ncbi:hypothetical protein M0813_13714 [Anaeramoeba flamelloides]|uniref:Uncharacterized protein n=1 Tax=Anaeramoeba flamelloides TaxID=1746091 RepID=A0ABQ8Z815_9EUKA|nr:hypothetical protein M0813_13714 [Anaeramoeba flamelloides]
MKNKRGSECKKDNKFLIKVSDRSSNEGIASTANKTKFCKLQKQIRSLTRKLIGDNGFELELESESKLKTKSQALFPGLKQRVILIVS